ncbi:MAG: FtsQ-type POTRA domain-containing protein [Bacilli bacterium]|nr:FtsQ-type POTRA domain-containing protein [Bacilli bacterium]
MAKSKKKKNKRKLNKKRFYTFIIIFILLVIFIYKLFNTNIKNIYISGNELLSDQEIIDIAKLKNYPNSISNLSFAIKNRLEDNKYILSVKVSKRSFISKVYIDIKENYPLFYYQVENKTILYNGDKVKEKFTVPTVINQIPNTIYDEFVKKISKVDKNILNRMSEIEYAPNDVDEERFFILMNDGNYVYLTLNKFLSINKYIEMIKSFDNKKGILHLDSGEYFDVFDE